MFTLEKCTMSFLVLWELVVCLVLMGLLQMVGWWEHLRGWGAAQTPGSQCVCGLYLLPIWGALWAGFSAFSTPGWEGIRAMMLLAETETPLKLLGKMRYFFDMPSLGTWPHWPYRFSTDYFYTKSWDFMIQGPIYILNSFISVLFVHIH